MEIADLGELDVIPHLGEAATLIASLGVVAQNDITFYAGTRQPILIIVLLLTSHVLVLDTICFIIQLVPNDQYSYNHLSLSMTNQGL
jgi:hypothetical protein